MPAHQEREHAIFSASSAHTALACKGFLFLKQTVPPAPTSPQAAEGTVMHELCDRILENFLRHKLDGEPLLEIVYDDHEMLEHATTYRDLIWKEVLGESITEKSYLIEQKLTLDEHFQMFCFADFATIYKSDRAKRTVHAVELKYGFTPVDVKNNAQLAFQLVSLREELRRNGKDADIFLASIFQPRVLNRPTFQTTKFTPKQLDTWKAKFLKIAHEVFIIKKPKFTVGEHCNLCSVRHACPARAHSIKQEQIVKLALSDGVELPKVPTIPMEDIGKYLAVEDKILDFFKGLRSFAINEMKSGRNIAGWKLVESTRKREWVDDVDRVVEFMKGVGYVEPLQKKLKGIGEIESALKSTLGITKKEASEIISPIVQLKPAGVSLVLENDPRPAVKNMRELFSTNTDNQSE